MKSRWIIGFVACVWVIMIIIQVSLGVEHPRAGQDALSHLFEPLSRVMAPLRKALLEASASLPSVGGQLLPGLAIGDTARVSEELDGAMKSASLTHLVAVSGANCHVVTAATFAAFSWLGAPRWLRIAGAATGLLFFVAVVTPGASIMRAAVMSIAVLIGLALGRLSAGLPVLALAVGLLLVIEPTWATNYGFILSVLATLGLLVLTTPITRWLERFMMPWLALALAVPISASLLCQPVIILLSPTLPTYGIAANVLAVPAAAVVTVIGLLICLTGLIFMPCAILLSWFAWLPSEWIGRVAQSLAALPFAQLAWPPGLVGFACAAILSVAMIVVFVRKRRGTGQLTKVAVGFIVGGLGGSLLWTIGSTQHAVAAVPADWRIVACDVGQGDAIVLKGIDAQGQSHFAGIDTGRTPAGFRDCLVRLGIRHLDLQVFTHFDLDHVGGASAVKGKTGEIFMQTPTSADEQRLWDEMCVSQVHCREGRAGMTGTLGDASWQMIWPDGRTPDMQSGNPGSISMVVNWPSFSAAFIGDLGAAAQDALLSSSLDLPRVDVLKVAHHGSADTSENLMNRFAPQIGLISVGADNGYGHPTRKALGMLEALGTVVGRTDKQGFLFVSFDGVRLRLDTDR
ncbi:MAG: hypothetical protein RLZZ600_1349 [Actinomycetota bacterium]